MNDQINIPARKRLCGVMRQFAIGRITNHEFDRTFEDIETLNRVANSIAIDTFAYYNEYATVRLTGKYQLSRQWRRASARWILFLQSGQEYQVRERSLVARLRGIGNWMVGDFIAQGEENDAYEEYTNQLWPFMTQADFDEARRHPKLLCGAR